MPEPKTQHRFDDDLKAYVDGELSPLRRARLAQHLRTCAACRRKEEEMRKLTHTLNAIGTADTPLSAPLRAKLLATAPAGRASDTVPPRPLWREKPGLVFGGGGAVLTASLIAFGMLYGPLSDDPTAAKTKLATMMYAQDYDANNGSTVVAAAGAAPAASGAAWPTKAAIDPSTEATASRAASATPEVRGEAIARAAPAAPMADAAVDKLSASRRLRTQGEAALYTPLVEERQVHREASLGVAVSNIETASASVERLVKEAGGYVASNNLTTDADGYKAADLTVKIPVNSFDEMMASIGKLGNVRSKSISGEDITEKVSDSTSDEQVLINETKLLEDRLKAGSLSERRTSETEAQLRQVRLQLARTRARLGTLRKLANLSTLSISLTEQAKVTAKAPAPSGFWHDLKDSNRTAWNAFQAAVRVPLLLLVWAVALSPIWLPLLLTYRYFARKQAATLAASTPPTPDPVSMTELDR